MGRKEERGHAHIPHFFNHDIKDSKEDAGKGREAAHTFFFYKGIEERNRKGKGGRKGGRERERRQNHFHFLIDRIMNISV